MWLYTLKWTVWVRISKMTFCCFLNKSQNQLGTDHILKYFDFCTPVTQKFSLPTTGIFRYVESDISRVLFLTFQGSGSLNKDLKCMRYPLGKTSVWFMNKYFSFVCQPLEDISNNILLKVESLAWNYYLHNLTFKNNWQSC